MSAHNIVAVVATAFIAAVLPVSVRADDSPAALAIPLTLDRPPVGKAPPLTISLGEPTRGWPQSLHSTIATPVFADLDQDGTQEIIVGDKWDLHVFDHDGVSRPGWPVGTGIIIEHVAVADIDGDQIDDIAVGSGYPEAMLRVYDRDGQPKPGWPVLIPVENVSNLTCPVIVDLDGDGAQEIGIAGELGVFFFRADGTAQPGWPYTWPALPNNPQWSAPAVGDVDRDGALEVVVGVARGPERGVHVIRADGTAQPGWPILTQPIYSSPALADLDHDGDLEIIVQEGDVSSYGTLLWVWHHTGVPMDGWPRTIAVDGHSSRCGPAIADVDGDGHFEIVTATCDGFIHVFRLDGSYFPGFPLQTPAPDYSLISSPSVVDIDEDGLQEIFLTYWFDFDHYVSAWRLDGTVVRGFPKRIFVNTDWNAHASQHVLDLEGDGDLDLVSAGTNMGTGKLWVCEIEGSSYNPATPAAWPKPRRDLRNTGCYPITDPAGIVGGEARAIDGLRLEPSVVRRGGLMTLRAPAALPGRVEVWDLAGRRIAARPLAGAGDEATLRAGDLFGREAGSGVFWMRWTPDRGAPARAARVLVLGD